MTKLQEAAYNAQRAAGLPTSSLGSALLAKDNGTITYQHCAAYIEVVQQMAWFVAAFPTHSSPLTVIGGKGVSRADALQRVIKIGADDRHDVSECEQACLHELAHIVTPDYGPTRQAREPSRGRQSSKGHHHAWRFNFVLLIRKTLGKQAALQLRYEFGQWGLPTSR